jgi:hypothetical protein
LESECKHGNDGDKAAKNSSPINPHQQHKILFRHIKFNFWYLREISQVHIFSSSCFFLIFNTNTKFSYNGGSQAVTLRPPWPNALNVCANIVKTQNKKLRLMKYACFVAFRVGFAVGIFGLGSDAAHEHLDVVLLLMANQVETVAIIIRSSIVFLIEGLCDLNL